MKASGKKRACAEAIPVLGTSAMLALLFDAVLLHPEPNLPLFWLSSIMIGLACYLCGRLLA